MLRSLHDVLRFVEPGGWLSSATDVGWVEGDIADTPIHRNADTLRSAYVLVLVLVLVSVIEPVLMAFSQCLGASRCAYKPGGILPVPPTAWILSHRCVLSRG